MKHLFLSLAIAGICLGTVLHADATPLRKAITYEPATLRGYGTLSGAFTPMEIDGQPASELEIVCESAEKAKIVQAKYCSDLQVLPGVRSISLNMAGTPIPAWQAAGQGETLSARRGATVYILTASTPKALARMEAQVFPGGAAQVAFAPEASVPPYLDRWDKLGFRIGCRPLEAPKGSSFQKYDQNQEFDWVVRQGKMGYVFWNWIDQVSTAESFVADHFWDWGYKAARDRGLSVEVNLAAGFGHGTQLWLANRYPQEMSQRMPGYVGSAYEPMGTDGGTGYISWNSGIAWDDQLAELQQLVRRFRNDPTIVGWQEPHSELRNNILREYGQVPDRTFRDWLRRKYKTLDAVAGRWGKGLKSWDDVHVPELASFLGWGPDALDLAGPWRVSWLDHGPVGKEQIDFPAGTLAADFDDSAWPQAMLPGDDHAMFLPKGKPGVFRRTFDVPAGWLHARPKVWLYLFDLNSVWGQTVLVNLNGQEVGRSPIRPYYPHADWYEVTAALKQGTNKLAVALPSGFIGYRAYLSGAEPREYPGLGAGPDAQWTDFVDWSDDSRVDQIRRSVEMIRQVDPDRDIYLASPGDGVSGLATLARQYGCDFHDTGGMTGSWNEYRSSLMAGAGLPMSLEPGNGFLSAGDVPAFLGHWATEGLQSIDYIQTVGEIYLHDDIRKLFEEHLNDWHLFGKYHVPTGQFATLYSSRVANLINFPWNKDPNFNLPTGAPRWTWLSDFYPHVGVTDTELIAGQADKYPVIIDSNTTIMDSPMIDAIERYVRRGGIFVTYVQTGRHSTDRANSWPISKLTGYSVTAIDPLDEKGVAKSRPLHLVEGQDVYAPDQWSSPKMFNCGNGLSLKKEAPECRDLMQWDDGPIAAGVRPLGKGFIFDLGVKFSNDKIWSGNRDATDKLLNGILRWAKLQPEPAQLENLALVPDSAPARPPSNPSEFDVFHWPGDSVKFRHYISNNGLFDVWALWNMKSQTITGCIHFLDISPGGAVFVKTLAVYPVNKRADGTEELRFQLGPGETQNFLTPRNQIAGASREWFELQRAWWQGTMAPSPAPLPSLASMRKFTLPLDDPWAVKTLAAPDDPAPLAAPGLDDSRWAREGLDLALLPLPAAADSPRRILLRRRFTVPAGWDQGKVTLWVKAWAYRTFWDEGQIYCDGQLIRDHGDAVGGDDFGGLFRPGSSHLLAMVIQSKSCYLGVAGDAWLSYRPDPLESLDLSGSWGASDDALNFNRAITIPGPWNAWMARRTIKIDAAHAGQNVLLHVKAGGGIDGVIINGRCVRQPQREQDYVLNLTPWIRFGQDNQMELLHGGGKGRDLIEKLSLDFYKPGVYP